MQRLLATQAHLGTKKLNSNMSSYVYTRRSDGVFVFNLAKTWEKLMLAARIIAAVENPKDVCVISSRQWGQRAVLKFAQHTGAKAIAGRFTPGTFTNQIQKQFMEPRVIVCTDPITDHQPIMESSYVNIPVIAFCHTDAPLRHVDVAIPINNKGKHSIGLMWWLLCREVLRMRDHGKYPRSSDWDVMVDMFIFREPDEIERQEEAQREAAAAAQAAAAAAAYEGTFESETAAPAQQDGDWAGGAGGGDGGGAGGEWNPPADGAAPAQGSESWGAATEASFSQQGGQLQGGAQWEG